MMRVAPEASVPSEHGYEPVQSPVLELNVTPEGVGSATLTELASDGPRFVTVTV